jgi:hypothetical protein
MMKKLLLVFVAGLGAIAVNAQGVRNVGKNDITKLDLTNQSNTTVKNHHQSTPATSNRGAVNFISVGTAGNCYSTLSGDGNYLAVEPTTKVIAFTHRTAPPATQGTGGVTIDISKDGGVTYTTNTLIYDNATTSTPSGNSNARYPQVALFNPSGNTTPNNVKATFMAPLLAGYSDQSTWGGTAYGQFNIGTPTSTSQFAKAPGTKMDEPGQTLILYGTSTAANGVTFSIDINYKGAAVSGNLLLHKVDASGVYSLAKELDLNLDTTFDAAPVGGYNMSFSPDGTKGWVIVSADVVGDNGVDTNTDGVTDAGVLTLNGFRTVDGGATWTGPFNIDINGISTIQDSLGVGFEEAGVDSADASFVPFLGFDFDVAVENNGKVHIFGGVGHASKDANYSIATGLGVRLYDITYDGTTVGAKYISGVNTFRGVAVGALTQDNATQIAISPDGSTLFYLWADTDLANINPDDPTANDIPDAWGARQVIATGDVNQVIITNGTIDEGLAVFPRLPMISLNNTECPVLIAAPQDPADDLQPCDYKIAVVNFGPVGVNSKSISFNISNIYPSKWCC